MATDRRLELIRTVAQNRQEGCVVLEDIHDPHNAEAVIRTCDALGFQTVHLIFEKEVKFNPRHVGVSSSSGSNKWLDFEIWDSTEKCLAALKGRGYATFATLLDATAKPLDAYDLTVPKVALIFGNEKNGLSETAARLADHKLYIPMRGFVQSFNLSVTAALCLREVDRQRRAAGKACGLPAEDASALARKWSAPA